MHDVVSVESQAQGSVTRSVSVMVNSSSLLDTTPADDPSEKVTADSVVKTRTPTEVETVLSSWADEGVASPEPIGETVSVVAAMVFTDTGPAVTVATVADSAEVGGLRVVDTAAVVVVPAIRTVVTYSAQPAERALV